MQMYGFFRYHQNFYYIKKLIYKRLQELITLFLMYVNL